MLVSWLAYSRAHKASALKGRIGGLPFYRDAELGSKRTYEDEKKWL